MSSAMVIIGLIIVFAILIYINGAEKDRVNAEMDRIANRDIEKGEPTTTNWQESMDRQDLPPTLEQQKRLLIETLTKLGCNPEKMKDREAIGAYYQGEHFIFECGLNFIRIWDAGWASVNTARPDYYQVLEAVNAANYEEGTTIVLTDADKDGERYLHTHGFFLFIPEIPHIEAYLNSCLSMFFNKKQALGEELRKIKEKNGSDKASENLFSSLCKN